MKELGNMPENVCVNTIGDTEKDVFVIFYPWLASLWDMLWRGVKCLLSIILAPIDRIIDLYRTQRLWKKTHVKLDDGTEVDRWWYENMTAQGREEVARKARERKAKE